MKLPLKNNICLRLTDVGASYDGKEIFKNLSLEVGERDYLAVTGANGCGKTTLMRIILGLKQPTMGTVEYFSQGHPVSHLDIGYLPQMNSIDSKFPISVEEVVMSGLNECGKTFFQHTTDAMRNQVDETLREMGIKELGSRAFGTLSGGQQQRALLARAIVSNPDIVILDEPNTYIDRHFQSHLYDMLDLLNKRSAIIIVTHDIAAIKTKTSHILHMERHDD